MVARYPDAVVLGSKVCLAFLENLMHTPFASRQVKGGDTVDLGGGHVMEFVMAPNLHWPDTMFTYDHATGVMYTCDAFGMHYCSEVSAPERKRVEGGRLPFEQRSLINSLTCCTHCPTYTRASPLP